LWQKRLEADQFAWPVDAKAPTAGCSLQAFGWLLEGFDLSKNIYAAYPRQRPLPAVSGTIPIQQIHTVLAAK